MSKTFHITFTKVVTATVEIEANSEAEAREAFDKGKGWENEKDIEANEVQFKEIEEL